MFTTGPRRLFATFAASACLLAAVPGCLPAQELRLTTSSATAQAEFRAGLDALENELPARATQHWQRAVAADPGFAIARAFHAAHAPGLTADARAAELQQAASAGMNITLGELLVIMSLRASPGSERRSLLKAAVDAVPGDRNVLFLHALNLERPDDRVRSYEALVRRFPDFAPAYRELALVRARELVDLPAAGPLMQKYLELQPDNPTAHHRVAQLLQWSGRFADAAQHYQHAIDRDPNLAIGYTGMAELELLQDRTTQARTWFEQAITKEKAVTSRFDLREAHTVTLLADGNVRVAMAELTRLANEADASGYRTIAARLHRDLAVVEAVFGNKSLVDSRLRKASTLTPPGNAEQLIFAATAYALAGDPGGARPLLRTINQIARDTASLIFKRKAKAVGAIVDGSAGDVTQALQSASEAGPQGALVRSVLAEVLTRRGRVDEAGALMAQVMASTETDVLSVIARARAKQRQ